MNIRLNDFSRQWAVIGADVLAVVQRVGESGRYILGEEVAAFERDLASFWGTASAVGVGSGLDALEIGLRCAGLAPGARVLTTPLSAFATTLAIIRAGGRPVFIDVDRCGLIDLDRCRTFLRRDRGVRCLVPVHLYGHTIDLDALGSLRAELGTTIVEDCAQSAGATWRGRKTGTAGEVAATSFYPTKNLGALGDGGAVLTDSSAIAARAKALRHYGQRELYAHDHIGLNSRLDELHAAILRHVLLPRLPEWSARRAWIATRYRRDIAHAALEIPKPAADSGSCWHLFPVLVPPAQRAEFAAHLRRRGVETAVHYPRLIPDQRALLEGGGAEIAGELANARRFVESEVSLPIHPFLSDEETARVVVACNEWRPA